MLKPMRLAFLILVLLQSFTSDAAAFAMPGAAVTGQEGEITDAPICGKLTNRSGQTIMGTLSTAPQVTGSGDAIRHRENFRLEPGDSEAFCTTGPFYAGRRIEIVIRTIIPLFDCRTRIDQTIYLDATPGTAFTKLSATCS